jgi:hypothetical protein
VTRATLLGRHAPDPPHPLESVMDRLAERSQQVALLRRWRAEQDRNGSDAAALQTPLLLTINAMSGGLGGTG